MVAYLDTQVIVRLMHGNRKLIRRAARRLIEASDLLISPMAALEVGFSLNLVEASWFG